MRILLMLLLAAVVSSFLWVIKTESYTNPLIFVGVFVMAGLTGYMVSEHFFGVEKSIWVSEVTAYRKEVINLNEQINHLHQQAIDAVSPDQLEEMERRMNETESAYKRINAQFMAQMAQFSSLQTRLNTLQKEYDKLKEDATIAEEKRNLYLKGLKEALSTAQHKLVTIEEENQRLRHQLTATSVEAPHQVFSPQQEVEASQTITTQNLTAQQPLMAIVGIDAAAAEALASEGILSYDDLAQTALTNLRDILCEHLENGYAYDPTTWPQQAALLAQEDKTGFEAYVKHLKVAEPANYELDAYMEQVIERIVLEEAEAEATRQYEQEEAEATKETVDIVIAEAAPSIDAQPVEGSPDDLKVVAGIEPRVEALLKAAGVNTWYELSEVSPEQITTILTQAGISPRTDDPASWLAQAKMLANGDWRKFREYRQELGYRETPKA